VPVLVAAIRAGRVFYKFLILTFYLYVATFCPYILYRMNRHRLQFVVYCSVWLFTFYFTSTLMRFIGTQDEGGVLDFEPRSDS